MLDLEGNFKKEEGNGKKSPSPLSFRQSSKKLLVDNFRVQYPGCLWRACNWNLPFAARRFCFSVSHHKRCSIAWFVSESYIWCERICEGERGREHGGDAESFGASARWTGDSSSRRKYSSGESREKDERKETRRPHCDQINLRSIVQGFKLNLGNRAI